MYVNQQYILNVFAALIFMYLYVDFCRENLALERMVLLS